MTDTTTETIPAEPPATPAPVVEAAPPTPPGMLQERTAEWQRSLALLADEHRSHLATLFDPGTKRAAEMFAASDMVPAHFRGKRENCFIVLHMADQLGESPVVLFQNLFFVHGKLGMEAKLLLHLVAKRGPFVGGIRFRTTGTKPAPGQEPPDDFTVVAYGIYPDGEEATAEASIGMAKAEGWYKSNPKYRSMPEQMLSYKAAAFLTRKACPGVTMGAYLREELQELRVEAAAPAPLAGPRPLGLVETARAEGATDAELS